MRFNVSLANGAIDSVIARRGITPDGRSLMQYGGSDLYLCCDADCFWPIWFVVSADSFESAYELALGDRSIPAADEDVLGVPVNDDTVEQLLADGSVQWSDDRSEYVAPTDVRVFRLTENGNYSMARRFSRPAGSSLAPSW